MLSFEKSLLNFPIAQRFCWKISIHFYYSLVLFCHVDIRMFWWNGLRIWEFVRCLRSGPYLQAPYTLKAQAMPDLFTWKKRNILRIFWKRQEKLILYKNLLCIAFHPIWLCLFWYNCWNLRKFVYLLNNLFTNDLENSRKFPNRNIYDFLRYTCFKFLHLTDCTTK